MNEWVFQVKDASLVGRVHPSLSKSVVVAFGVQTMEQSSKWAGVCYWDGPTASHTHTRRFCILYIQYIIRVSVIYTLETLFSFKVY